MYMPATLSFNDQFYGLFSLFGLQADEIHSVGQVAELDGIETFVDAEHLLADDVEQFNLQDALAFNAEHILGGIRIDGIDIL